MKETKNSAIKKRSRMASLKKWSERRDSNPRPRPWQGRALPTELLSRLRVQR